MRAEAGDAAALWLGVRLLGVVVQLDGHDVHAVNVMSSHRRAHSRRHDAQVFADDGALVALRFQGEDRVDLFGPVLHVDALAGAAAGRDPVKTMQAHDVVEAHRAGDPHVVLQELAVVAIAVAAQALRARRAEAPVLARCGDDVRRGANGRAFDEELREAPAIVTVGMHADWQVEVEAAIVLTGSVCDRFDLALRAPLGKGEELSHVRVVVAVA